MADDPKSKDPKGKDPWVPKDLLREMKSFADNEGKQMVGFMRSAIRNVVNPDEKPAAGSAAASASASEQPRSQAASSGCSASQGSVWQTNGRGRQSDWCAVRKRSSAWKRSSRLGAADIGGAGV